MTSVSIKPAIQPVIAYAAFEIIGSCFSRCFIDKRLEEYLHLQFMLCGISKQYKYEDRFIKLLEMKKFGALSQVGDLMCNVTAQWIDETYEMVFDAYLIKVSVQIEPEGYANIEIIEI